MTQLDAASEADASPHGAGGEASSSGGSSRRRGPSSGGFLPSRSCRSLWPLCWPGSATRPSRGEVVPRGAPLGPRCFRTSIPGLCPSCDCALRDYEGFWGVSGRRARARARAHDVPPAPERPNRGSGGRADGPVPAHLTPLFMYSFGFGVLPGPYSASRALFYAIVGFLFTSGKGR